MVLEVVTLMLVSLVLCINIIGVWWLFYVVMCLLYPNLVNLDCEYTVVNRLVSSNVLMYVMVFLCEWFMLYMCCRFMF